MGLVKQCQTAQIKKNIQRLTKVNKSVFFIQVVSCYFHSSKSGSKNEIRTYHQSFTLFNLFLLRQFNFNPLFYTLLLAKSEYLGKIIETHMS